jgi:hypothetical protein
MKLVSKIVAMSLVAINTSLLVSAQGYIENNATQAQTASFWINGIGKVGNGVVLAKEGADVALTGFRLLNFAETRGANFQLTGGTAPGLATWIHDGTNWLERMRILPNGYVGIGTTAPTRKFVVYDTSTVKYAPLGTGYATPGGGMMEILNVSNIDGTGAHFIMTATNALGYKGAAYIGAVSNKDIWTPDIVIGHRTVGNSWVERIKITANGNVGIGRTPPSEYKLAVDGTIAARRVKVTQETWADFVFEPQYKLPSLSELESYIKANKHLPDVPSAVDVTKDGLDLGEMNKILLQKIEELTLHLIDQNKLNKDQQKQIESLQEAISKLTSKLSNYGG